MQNLFNLVRNVLVGGPAAQDGEQRTAPRARLQARLVCRTRLGKFPARLIDLTADGMRLKTPGVLKPGMKVTVSARPREGLEGRQRLRCVVAWTKRRKLTEAGLAYADSPQNLAFSWVQMALHELEPEAGQRRTRRVPVELPVTIVDAKEFSYDALCLDLGTGGARVELDRPLPEGSVVFLRLGELVLKARVVSAFIEETGLYGLGLRFYPGENRQQRGLKGMLLGMLDEVPT